MLSTVGRKENTEKEHKIERNTTEMRDILNCVKEMQSVWQKIKLAA